MVPGNSTLSWRGTAAPCRGRQPSSRGKVMVWSDPFTRSIDTNFVFWGTARTERYAGDPSAAGITHLGRCNPFLVSFQDSFRVFRPLEKAERREGSGVSKDICRQGFAIRRGCTPDACQPRKFLVYLQVIRLIVNEAPARRHHSVLESPNEDGRLLGRPRGALDIRRFHLI